MAKCSFSVAASTTETNTRTFKVLAMRATRFTEVVRVARVRGTARTPAVGLVSGGGEMSATAVDISVKLNLALRITLCWLLLQRTHISSAAFVVA